MFYVCLPSIHPKFHSAQTEVRNTAFCTLYLPQRRGRPQWRKLRKKLPDTPFCALVASPLAYPEFIRPYYTGGYYRRLLLNAFLQVTKGAGHLALVDPDGRLPEVASELMGQARQVTVYTYAHKVYAPYCARWLSSFGTQPVFTRRLGLLQDAEAVFSPFGCDVLPQNPRRMFGAGGWAVSTEDLPLPEDIQQVLPAGISPFDFAAALYTQCDQKALGQLLPTSLIFQNQRVDIREIRRNNFCIDNAQ